MKFKKIFKHLFTSNYEVEKQVIHHRRKFGFLHWSGGIQKVGLLHWLIPTILGVAVIGTVATQVSDFRISGFSFTKPKPITEANTTLSPNVQQAIEDLAKQEIKQEQANATLPVNISLLGEDTVQTNVGLLDELFATNPSEKAKIKIKKIDQKIIKLRNLLIEDKSDKAIDEALKLIEEIGKETAQVATDPKVITDRQVLGLIIEQYNRLQLILQQLEDTLPVNAYLKVEDARQKYLVVTATASINAAPNLDAVHNIALKEVAKVVGEDFAELKAIEIVSDFEAGVKPEARDKLLGLERELAVEFEKRMLKLPRDVRNRKLQEYIQYSFGDPLVQIHALNRIKEALSDRELILGVDGLKELAMNRLIDRIFELKDQQSINKFLERVIQNPEDLKVMTEMQLAVNSGQDEARKQRLKEMEQSVAGRIAQFFSQGNIEDYFAPKKDKPTDILDVRLISSLNDTIAAAPEISNELKQKFANLKTAVRKRFIEEISAKDFSTKSTLSYNPVGSNADVRILLSSPQGILLLQQIRNESSSNERSKIDIAIRAQSAIIQEHLLVQVNNPEVFENYQAFINQNPQVKQTLQTNLGQNFITNLSKKSQAIQKVAKEDEQHLYEVIQQIVQAIFITDDKTNFERKLPSDIQQQITQLKQTLPDKNIPQLTVPEGVNLPKVAKLSSSIEQAIVHAAKQRIKEKQRTEEVKLDLKVQAKDLGISEPSVLPDNPLYPIKRLIRNIQLALTFDPLQRAQVLIRQDNEKTLEAAKLLEKSSSRKTIDLALATLAEVEKDFNKLKENSGKLDKLRQEQPKKVDQIVDQIIRNGLARQTVFSSIEDKVYGADFVRVEKIRQSVLKDGVDSLLQLTGGDAQALVLKLEQAVNDTSGSKFKELKAIELLTEIKRFQPKRIDAILGASEIRLIKQFETHLLALEKKEREQELLAYADSIPGNPVRQFEAYEELKDGFTNEQSSSANKETLLLVEALKDKAVENLRDQVSEITDGQTLQEFVSEVVGNKPEDLKIIIAIEARVDTPNLVGELPSPIEEKIEEIKSEVEQNVIENIINDPTTLTESELVSDLNTPGNTTIGDVEVIHELEEILENTPDVSPEIVETIHQIEEQVIEDFVETVTQNPTQALEPVPQVIETLVELKEEQPPAIDASLDLAIKTEVEIIKEHLETQVDSPETLETVISQIKENPVVSEVIVEVGGSEFNQTLQETVTEVSQTATQEQTLLEETVQQIEQEIFSGTESGQEIIETLLETVQQEIEQVQQEVPVEQIPQVEVSTQTQVSTETNIQPIETTPVSTPAPVETSAPTVESPTTSTTTQEQTQSAPAVEQPAAPVAPAVPGL